MNRHVARHLGTVITLCADAPPAVVAEFFASIAGHEALLSRFRPDSEVSRLARGELSFDGASPAVRRVLGECDRLRLLTCGDFDHEPRRHTRDPDDPILDTDAFAKGWIIDQACPALRLGGIRSFLVNAGGDVVAGDAPAGRTSWRVGIRDPDDPSGVVAALDLANTALATSGAYERGDHIRGARRGLLSSVTVIGPDLAVADALATAVFAAGSAVPSWWEHDGEYAVVAVDGERRLRWTRSAERYGLTALPAA